MSTTPLELPIARTTHVAQQRLDPLERDQLIRRAKALSWLSLADMTAEARSLSPQRSSPAQSRCWASARTPRSKRSPR
jgi:hypothetical protein